MAKTRKPEFYPIILAGGRGTRFWPLSRKTFAKQLLPLNSAQSMIQETVARLLPMAPGENFWVITNGDLRAEHRAPAQISCPASRLLPNPWGATPLPPSGLRRSSCIARIPEAVLGLFPSDQVIQKQKQFRKDLQTGIALAAAGENIVVMGVKANPPGDRIRICRGRRRVSGRSVAGPPFSRKAGKSSCGAVSCRRKFLLEQRNVPVVGQNAGECLAAISAGNRRAAGKDRGHLGHAQIRRNPAQALSASVRTRAWITPSSNRVPHAGEEGSNIFCIPADWGWNDLGSWAAHFEHRIAQGQHKDNVISAAGSFLLDAHGNYLHAPGNLLPRSEWRALWWWTPATHC